MVDPQTTSDYEKLMDLAMWFDQYDRLTGSQSAQIQTDPLPIGNYDLQTI